ncbi:AbrB/MazE/SpoVT family DNA-binding domain-containing protein [Patescibacteria group bacterium]|nr:AbrB/MazE/SpoVT family DNA-binding domain-containing protein [Patescibacteria group bacterium]MCL5798172.1 AbrB/MazE/SpoVT family DNA-binding domain-containing protein [Patescibacteria group bacterium]
MRQKIIRVGRSSLAVIIPANFVHSLGIRSGDSVLVKTMIDKGVINLHFSGAVQLRLPSGNKPKLKK